MSPKWNKSLARSGAPYTPSHGTHELDCWNRRWCRTWRGRGASTKPKQSAAPEPVSDGGVDVLRTELNTAKEDLKAERTHLDEAEKNWPRSPNESVD